MIEYTTYYGAPLLFIGGKVPHANNSLTLISRKMKSKSFTVYNATITEKGNTTLTLKGGAKPFLFGGIQQTSAKGEFCWISFTGNVLDSYPIGKEINDLPESAFVDEDTGELILG